MAKPSIQTAGAIRPDEVYVLAELKRRTGWGDAAVRAARRAGLKPIYAHGRVFFQGVAIIAYLEQVARDAERETS